MLRLTEVHTMGPSTRPSFWKAPFGIVATVSTP